jgi:hypothetical protein
MGVRLLPPPGLASVSPRPLPRLPQALGLHDSPARALPLFLAYLATLVHVSHTPSIQLTQLTQPE